MPARKGMSGESFHAMIDCVSSWKNCVRTGSGSPSSSPGPSGWRRMRRRSKRLGGLAAAPRAGGAADFGFALVCIRGEFRRDAPRLQPDCPPPLVISSKIEIAGADVAWHYDELDHFY